ncbi:MAG TPA: hypothetical protein VH722_18380 [Alphaproteobacteria bacterium]|nr:hypothetical protein [Alphaproteobacteria bacterium]
MTGWIRAAILALAALLVAAAGPAGEPTIRIRVETTPPYAVGRPIVFRIEVLTPNYFLSAPHFPTIDIPGAVVTEDDRAFNFTETIDGVAYSGIRTGYTIVPQQPGPISLPPAAIGFTYAALPGQSATGSVTVPPQRFEITPATGGTAVSELIITQSFDRDPAKLTAGDAFNRTITIQRPDAPAMTIAPPAIETPDGVKLYRHDPVLYDEQQVGRRVETVTYVFPTAGNYRLPPVSAGRAQAAEIQVHVANAAARPAIAPEGAKGLARIAEIDWRFWIPRIVGLALVVAIWRCWRKTLCSRLAAWREHRRQAEPACFARLAAACRGGDGPAVYRALRSWSHRADIRSLDDWAIRFGDAGLAAEIHRLEASLFASRDDEGWSPRRIAAELALARRRWRASRKIKPRTALPELNDLFVSYSK